MILNNIIQYIIIFVFLLFIINQINCKEGLSEEGSLCQCKNTYDDGTCGMGGGAYFAKTSCIANRSESKCLEKKTVKDQRGHQWEVDGGEICKWVEITNNDLSQQLLEMKEYIQKNTTAAKENLQDIITPEIQAVKDLIEEKCGTN